MRLGDLRPLPWSRWSWTARETVLQTLAAAFLLLVFGRFAWTLLSVLF